MPSSHSNMEYGWTGGPFVLIGPERLSCSGEFVSYHGLNWQPFSCGALKIALKLSANMWGSDRAQIIVIQSRILFGHSFPGADEAGA